MRTPLMPLVLLALPAVLLAGCGGERDAFDRAALESAEDHTEALANDLLAFSVAVRDRDDASIAEKVADNVRAAPPPAAPSPLVPLERWISKRSWDIGAAPAAMSRDEFLGRFTAFLDRFTEIEDARFKVVSASFDEADGLVTADAEIKFFLIARDEEGRREWVKGKAALGAEREADGPWRITAFAPHEMLSKTADVDLFSEIAFPAGIAGVFPPFGVGNNEGFISHGVAVADVNKDGLPDIAATGVDENYLFLNAGDGTFRDVSDASLVRFAPIGSGALFLDYDNDGDDDLFFAAVGNQVLLENRMIPDGEPLFMDVSEKSGVARAAVGFSALAGDVNGDGLPDIYVCSYNRYGTVMPNSWYRATNGTPNLLFVNRGDGTFEEQGAAWGVDDARWSYAAGFADLDDDGDLDLYVANDFGENALYRNEGGRFVDAAPDVGLVDPGFGMGVSFGDYDNDGDLDLHITNMSSTAGNRILKLLYPEDHEIRRTLSKQASGNSLYERLDDGTYEDVTAKVGGLSGGWGFGGGFIDVDNDGWEDLYAPNGFVSGKSMKDT